MEKEDFLSFFKGFNIFRTSFLPSNEFMALQDETHRI